jgi:hypothetical protein
MKTLINNSNTLLAGESFKNEDYCEDCNISYYNKLLDLEKQEKRLLIHSFHRYFGKLIPAIPRFSIKEFTKKGDIVMDPFCGSGTTLVESMIQSRYSYGLDLNPLSCLISNTKTSLIEEEVLLHAKENLFDEINSDNKVDFEKDTPFCINMTHWFKPFVIKDLVVIKRNIDKIPCGNVKNFFLSCLSSILRDVSNADPRHIFPGYSNNQGSVSTYEPLQNITEIEMYPFKIPIPINQLPSLINADLNLRSRRDEVNIPCKFFRSEIYQ